MTQVGTVYGEALYELALSEGLDETIRQELDVLEQVFRAEPDYGKLLRSANLSKAERCVPGKKTKMRPCPRPLPNRFAKSSCSVLAARFFTQFPI